MNRDTALRLLELNQQFYQSFAGPFSESRRRLQPGVARLLKRIPPEGSVLDLGCGPGTLALELTLSGYRGSYLGLDSSASLLEVTREALRRLETSDSHDPSRGETGPRRLETPDSGAPRGTGASFIFRQVDLAEPDWVRALPSRPFDAILAFAVLHHIPGAGARLRLASQVREHLSPEGQFFLSNWQFLESSRLRERIQPWKLAGISPADVEPGDYLLDWRRGGTGLRYVHHFSLEELASLAVEAGFAVEDSFYSDGEGGRLGLYQVWVPG